MSIATAAQFRREVLVDVPGTELQIRCRQPNLLSQIANGVLPMSLVQKALEILGDASFDMTKADSETVRSYADFVDRWACLAAREPRIVATEQEAATDPNAVWVDDLDVDVKIAILVKTIGEPPAEVVARFRARQSASAAPGSDSPAVRRETVEPPVGDGSESGARP